MLPGSSSDISGGLSGNFSSYTDSTKPSLTISSDTVWEPGEGYDLVVWRDGSSSGGDVELARSSVTIAASSGGGEQRTLSGNASKNVFTLGSDERLDPNAGVGDDVYVISRYQYGSVTIEDAAGSNVIAFDSGVRIVGVSGGIDDGYGGFSNLQLTLGTGAVVTVITSEGYSYALGSAAAVDYAAFKSGIGSPSSVSAVEILTAFGVPGSIVSGDQRTLSGDASSNIFTLGSDERLDPNAGAGDDVYVLTRFQHGAVTIEDAAGSNVIKLESGVTVQSVSGGGDDGFGGYNNLQLTLGTGAVVTVITPEGYDYQIGDGVVLEYAGFKAFIDAVTANNTSFTIEQNFNYNIVIGTSGNDVIDDYEGNDGSGNALPLSSVGMDFIFAGAGKDIITGGAGNDVFDLGEAATGSDAAAARAAADVIKDYTYDASRGNGDMLRTDASKLWYEVIGRDTDSDGTDDIWDTLIYGGTTDADKTKVYAVLEGYKLGLSAAQIDGISSDANIINETPGHVGTTLAKAGSLTLSSITENDTTGNTAIQDTGVTFQATGTDVGSGAQWWVSDSRFQLEHAFPFASQSASKLQLKSGAQFDYETDHDGTAGTLTLTVTLRDTTGKMFTDTVQFTISDADDAPQFARPKVTVTSGETTDTFHTAAATDQDGNSITYSIKSGVGDAALFSISGSSGALSFTAVPTYDATTPANNTKTVTVVATANGQTAEQVVTVNILDSDPGTVTLAGDTAGEAWFNSGGAVNAWGDVNAGGAQVTYAIKANSTTGGTATVDANGHWVFTSSAAGNGSFTITATAANNGTDEQEITITTVAASLVNGTTGADSSLGDSAATTARIIQGNDENDSLSGGTANDVLIGGYGADTMDGGGGDDLFVYRLDSSYTDPQNKAGIIATDGGDTINNFDRGSDRLMLIDMATTDPLADLAALMAEAATDLDNGSIVLTPSINQAGDKITGFTIGFNKAGTRDGSATGTDAGSVLTINFKAGDELTVDELEALDGSAPSDTDRVPGDGINFTLSAAGFGALLGGSATHDAVDLASGGDLGLAIL